MKREEAENFCVIAPPVKDRVRSDIALRTETGLYVTALGAEGNWLLAGQALRVLGWENFTLLRVADGRFALKTAHGKYVTACPESEGFILQGRADRILGWELFELIENGERFTLKTGHNRFLRVASKEDRYVLKGDAATQAEASWVSARLL